MLYNFHGMENKKIDKIKEAVKINISSECNGMKIFEKLQYTKEDVENDAINFFRTQLYLPSYIAALKDFLEDDLIDFKDYYDDQQYIFQYLYYDEYITGYEEKDDKVLPCVNYQKLKHFLENTFAPLQIEDDEVKNYIASMENEFNKNSFLSHMEPYFIDYDGVASTVVAGYSQDPLCSAYSIIRECAMALHLKKLQPELMRKFGYRYQCINENYDGEERLKKMHEYRQKYRLTFKNVGAFRAVHSSVFAYTYLYIRACLTGEGEAMEEFILDNSSSQIFLLLQGEILQTIDFPIVKYALRKLKEDGYRVLVLQNGAINWDKLYDFVVDVIHATGGMSNLRSLGFEGISAKTIQSFWNKSANLQKMLKILRQLSMDNSDPIFRQLIDMCEYRLGRPVNDQKKMERFIAMTRRIMERERTYELLHPRTMAQELLAAFPSVFLVYFQWHHNFRNIYPKISPQQAYSEQQVQNNRQAQSKLTTRIYSESVKNKELENARQTQKVKEREAVSTLSFRAGTVKENFEKEKQEKEKKTVAAEKVNWTPITNDAKEAVKSPSEALQFDKQRQNSL